MAHSNVFSVLILSSSILELQAMMCPMDVQACSDGSYVSRDPKLNCQFSPCPTDSPMRCTADVRKCIDGSWLSRDAKNGCAFPPCPDILACTEDAQQCPDGSWVSRDAANNCEFSPCPDIIAPVVDEVGCGIDHCNSFYDGCNQCGCGRNGFPFCTLMYCQPDAMEKSFCTGCEAGYIVNKATNKCEGCVCTADYTPVCCDDGKTYSNQCRASCEQATQCVPGECRVSNAALNADKIAHDGDALDTHDDNNKFNGNGSVINIAIVSVAVLIVLALSVSALFCYRRRHSNANAKEAENEKEIEKKDVVPELVKDASVTNTTQMEMA